MTHRERRERRAARLREWAEKREAKATASFSGVAAIADGIPLGQPLLVGHHSYRRARRDQDRIREGMARGLEHQRTAERMTERAGNIEHQLDRSIYSDDPDAADRLRERIAELEADRDRKKKVNAAYRRGLQAYAEAEGITLDQATRRSETIEGLPSWARKPYELTNLSANIARLRKRLAGLEAPDA